MGSGNTIVEFFSEDIEFSVWKRYVYCICYIFLNICIGNEVNYKPEGILAAELRGTARWSARPPSGPSRLSSPHRRQSPLDIETSDQKNKVASLFITFALASLLASASAAMALWSISGSLASLLKKQTLWTKIRLYLFLLWLNFLHILFVFLLCSLINTILSYERLL